MAPCRNRKNRSPTTGTPKESLIPEKCWECRKTGRGGTETIEQHLNTRPTHTVIRAPGSKLHLSCHISALQVSKFQSAIGSAFLSCLAFEAGDWPAAGAEGLLDETAGLPRAEKSGIAGLDGTAAGEGLDVAGTAAGIAAEGLDGAGADGLFVAPITCFGAFWSRFRPRSLVLYFVLLWLKSSANFEA